MFLSYLASGITATDTTIEVPDGSIFPQNQVFDLWVDREKMACMSFASANVLNVERGHEGTVAVAHDADDLVALDTAAKQPVRTSKALDDHISAADPHTQYTMNADTDISANSWVIDEDDMVSDLATKVPTQQSVKAYVDAQALDTDPMALVWAIVFGG